MAEPHSLVKKQLEEGLSSEQVRKHLVESGWSEKEADDILTDVKKDLDHNAGFNLLNKKVFSIAVVILVLLTSGLVMYNSFVDSADQAPIITSPDNPHRESDSSDVRGQETSNQENKVQENADKESSSQNFRVNIKTGSGGKTSLDEDLNRISKEKVIVEPIPQNGYAFSHWNFTAEMKSSTSTGDEVENRKLILKTPGNYSINAVFETCQNCKTTSSGTTYIEGQCGSIKETSRSRDKAIDYVIVPAKVNYSQDWSYTNKDKFIQDAETAVQTFLSIEPINEYSSIFSFRYSTGKAHCSLSESGSTECKKWREAANTCGQEYDEVIILEDKDGGGLCCSPIRTASRDEVRDGLTFTHEIAHNFGLADPDTVGPNTCTEPGECGERKCNFEDSGKLPAEEGGPQNCYVNTGDVAGTKVYMTNEKSVMKYDQRYEGGKFTDPGRAHLDNIFLQVKNQGLSEFCSTTEKSLSICYGIQPQIIQSFNYEQVP